MEPWSAEEFVTQLRQVGQDHYHDKHPYHVSMNEGRLTPDQIQLWVANRYYYQKSIPLKDATLLSRCPLREVRRVWVQRILDHDGYGDDPGGIEKWLRLGEGLGVRREEVSDWRTFTRTHFAMSTLRTYSRYWDWSWLDGLATFYAVDLHWREYYGKVRDALADHYHVDDRALEFFSVLLADTESHIPWEEEALAYWPCTTERQLTAARSFRERLDIENQLLVALEQARTEEKLPYQVPA